MTKRQMKRFCVSAVVFALLLALGGCNKLPQNPTPSPLTNNTNQTNSSNSPSNQPHHNNNRTNR